MFAVAKGVQPSSSSDYKPVTKKSVTYIVMGVLINDKSEVLMMQEAKESCAGQWYLPAGRMEPGETIEEAVKREVLEETGLDMEPTTLLAVETASGSWYRFVLTGCVIGEMPTISGPILVYIYIYRFQLVLNNSTDTKLLAYYSKNNHTARWKEWS